jgi:hypothetical protein
MVNLHRISQRRMETDPYQWAFVDRLFSAEDAAQLAATFPRDGFKKVAGDDGEKSYEYMARSLIHMGAAVASHAEGLSPAWRALAEDLLSAGYRSALTGMVGRDLSSAPMEINVIEHGPGARLATPCYWSARIDPGTPCRVWRGIAGRRGAASTWSFTCPAPPAPCGHPATTGGAACFGRSSGASADSSLDCRMIPGPARRSSPPSHGPADLPRRPRPHEAVHFDARHHIMTR